MIGKIPKPGKSFGGCIQYNVLKKDAAILDADGIRIDKVAHIIDDFNRQRKMNPGLGQAVGHISLSWSPNDKDKLSDEIMVSIAKEYLQKMKIKDTQVLMVRHKDRDHPHIHIVYNRVNNEGKTIPDSFQRQKNIKICKELTLEHGLYIGQGKQMVNRQQLKGIDRLKYQLHDTIKAISQKVNGMDELKQELAKQGIGMLYKYKSGTKEVQGISFSKGEYKFKGSEIDRSLSYGHLSKAIEEQRQQSKQQSKSLADELRQVLSKERQQTTYLKKVPETNYLKQTIEKLNPLEKLLTAKSDADMPDIPEQKKKKKPEHKQDQGMHR
jgi:Relaxase/Mobilisation nuclease domain